MRQSANYSWIQGYLFEKGLDHLLRRCIREDETHDILHAWHGTPSGGHFLANKVAYKIL